MLKSVTKEIVYKEAYFQTAPEKALQEMLIETRKQLRLASEREEKLGVDKDSSRLWNSTAQCGHLTCGMFHTYESGRSQLIIGISDDLEEYSLNSSEAPELPENLSKSKIKAEFNEGLLYFGVTDNHVAILQSFALRVRSFEEYLNWLLREKSAQLGKDNFLQLIDPPSKKRLKDRTLKPLQSVVISPSFETNSSNLLDSSTDPTNKRFSVQLRNWSLLRGLLSITGAELPEDLKLGSDYDSKHLQVNIELKWLNGKKDRAETPVLDTIMHAFQDIQNPPIRAIMVGGHEIKGEELRLRKPATIQANGKILVEDSVYREMLNFLVNLKKVGDIA